MYGIKAKNYREMASIFVKYVVPTVASQLLSGVYTIVDGFFVGVGAGEAGLAAIGIAFPLTLFPTALGAGIGAGGGTLISISRGMENHREAESIFVAMLSLMFLFSALSMILLIPLLPALVALYGAPGELSSMAVTYARILLIASPFQVFSLGLLGATRNSGHPRKAMYIMTSGFVLNIILDWMWVVVFPYGLKGAAWATAVSELLTAVLFAVHFLSGSSSVRAKFNNVLDSLRLSLKIIKMGFSPFGVQMAASVTMIMHNRQALVYGGAAGLAAYSVISYVVPVGIMLQEGIAEGMQPLVSYYHGASLKARRKATVSMGFGSAAAIGLLCSVLVLVSAAWIPHFFSMYGKTALIARRGLILSSPLFSFLGLSKVGASYYMSVERPMPSSFLTYADPLLILPFFLWSLPCLWGLDGVWLSMTFANVALSAILMIMWRVGHTPSLRSLPVHRNI